MTSQAHHLDHPRLLFEVSWEVCNMVGGIYTVLATKVEQMQKLYGDGYIVVGPWLPNDDTRSLIEEDLFPHVREALAKQGIPIHTGRWDVPGSPRCVLVDFSRAYKNKDEVLEWMWSHYGVDSLSGGWDYIEPVLFGYTCGRVIESFVETRAIAPHCDVIAQWHEWMVGSGLLYLKRNRPQVAGVFTTHATVLGRAISGRGERLDDALLHDDTIERARHLGIGAKASLESALAREADCFTTVSPATADESRSVLDRSPDVILLNALGDKFPDPTYTEPERRAQTRATLFRLAKAVTGTDYASDDILAITSGRYEFINKGIDLVLDSLATLRDRMADKPRRLVCFVCTPSDATGPVPEVANAFREDAAGPQGSTSHLLRHPENDPTLEALQRLAVNNDPGDNVHVVLVPIYLDGTDPMITAPYYELLAGFDISIFPSYYEPWGYTPHESIGYGIPTVTSDLAGFGQWAAASGTRDPQAVYVLPRANASYEESQAALVDHLERFVALDAEMRSQLGQEAYRLSQLARWEHFGAYYKDAHERALISERGRFAADMGRLRERRRAERPDTAPLDFVVGDRDRPHMLGFTVRNRIPESLARLRDLSQNLWWSWHPEAEAVFRDLDEAAWQRCGHNPVTLLEELPQSAFDERASDSGYVSRLHDVLGRFDDYLAQRAAQPVHVAYFCMEYGIHESMPLYSGGLGVLAGDHLKAASDENAGLVAVGLAYRSGYFRQRLDRHGRQLSEATLTDPRTLPMRRLRDDNGDPILVSLRFPGRDLLVGAWQVRVGAVTLYLLDCDLEENEEGDRTLTAQLYSGDQEWRLQQEIVLGVGGRALLDRLGLQPSVFHINEGHAAFLILSRTHKLVTGSDLDFDSAFEYVRRTTVFTTHTPVAAGHDAFPEAMVRPYFAPYEEQLHIPWDRIMSLGRNAGEGGEAPFSMTLLGLHGAARINGVSKIHAGVSRKNLAPVAPGFDPSELAIDAITNGVHRRTWVAAPYQRLLEEAIAASDRDWPSCLDGAIAGIPDDAIRSARAQLKSDLLAEIRKRVEAGGNRRGESPALRRQISSALDEKALVIGFARRFAPYKRATLLFRDLEALDRILQQPVLFLFAGKAHPADQMGQELIQRIFELSRKPEYLGKIVLLEDYDMALARRLVQGCDIWLNTPTPPLEASGTSGMKAAMNGALNLSIADGWWAEAYDGTNGWVIGGEQFENVEHQDDYDSQHLYQLLEEEVLPLHLAGGGGMSDGWLQMLRRAMTTSLHAFSATRMLGDYGRMFYAPGGHDASTYSADDYGQARATASDKQRVRKSWRDVRINDVRMSGLEEDSIYAGDELWATVSVDHAGLEATDIHVQLVIGAPGRDTQRVVELTLESVSVGSSKWHGCYQPERSGARAFGVRVVPALRSSPEDRRMELDFALAKWA
ncbi:MAG: alpha-glucan family phosphorylase [Planctomycetota bacterium]